MLGHAGGTIQRLVAAFRHDLEGASERALVACDDHARAPAEPVSAGNDDDEACVLRIHRQQRQADAPSSCPGPVPTHAVLLLHAPSSKAWCCAPCKNSPGAMPRAPSSCNAKSATCRAAKSRELTLTHMPISGSASSSSGNLRTFPRWL